MTTDKRWELYSSAFTMSDMEIFIFPDLLHSMVLSNIMSPKIWEWKSHPWFSNIDKLNFNKKINRLKQFIMDNYNFNLDLETWGLTTKEKELDRFRGYIDPEIISESNALFGYEGDKYYFSIDIRKHFGLDKFNSSIIPYWKTETIEAMDAFRFKKGHSRGAGECVSLSSLYAAALYVVLGIPLEDIFLIATPLHSQNFIMKGDGVITNNRRILTRNMWYNGTILSDKARRAIENEGITYVSHISGYIHSIYGKATIDEGEYSRFKTGLSQFLKTIIDGKILINFLRSYNSYRKYFQFSYNLDDSELFITAEKLYEYEHSSKNRFDDTTRKKLFPEIDMDDFDLSRNPERYVINDIEKELDKNTFSCHESESLAHWCSRFSKIDVLENMIRDLTKFTCISPRFPATEGKTFITHGVLKLPPPDTTNRSEIIDYLDSKRNDSIVADLAFFAGRYCKSKREWPYYLKSAIERNPVTIEYFRNMDFDSSYGILKSFESESIYGSGQFAQPDEVVNYGRGDGIEKIFTLANLIFNRDNETVIIIAAGKGDIEISFNDMKYTLHSEKNVTGKFIISKESYSFED